MSACEICDDSGWVSGPAGARKCVCRQQSAWTQKLDRAGIPRRYQRKTFDDYDGTKSRAMGAALVICRGFAAEWPTNRHQGLTLTGPVGVGKTHLVCVTLMECCRKWSATVAFVDLPELFSKIKATFDPGVNMTEWEVLKPILAADILAIDEVDAARQSDWNFAMAEHILNTRYNADKSTILTTNSAVQPVGWAPPAETARPQLVSGGATFAEMARTMAPAATLRRDTLGDRIGARMFSRVLEMTRVVELDGPDQRAEAGRRRTS